MFWERMKMVKKIFFLCSIQTAENKLSLFEDTVYIVIRLNKQS